MQLAIDRLTPGMDLWQNRSSSITALHPATCLHKLGTPDVLSTAALQYECLQALPGSESTPPHAAVMSNDVVTALLTPARGPNSNAPTAHYCRPCSTAMHYGAAAPPVHASSRSNWYTPRPLPTRRSWLTRSAMDFTASTCSPSSSPSVCGSVRMWECARVFLPGCVCVVVVCVCVGGGGSMTHRRWRSVPGQAGTQVFYPGLVRPTCTSCMPSTGPPTPKPQPLAHAPLLSHVHTHPQSRPGWRHRACPPPRAAHAASGS
jgi:hypothetical protein